MNKEKRLMMSKEEVIQRVKGLLYLPKEDLIIQHLFLEQEIQKRKEVIDKAIELLNNHTILLPTEYSDEVANFKRNLRNILKEVDND